MGLGATCGSNLPMAAVGLGALLQTILWFYEPDSSEVKESLSQADLDPKPSRALKEPPGTWLQV